MKKRTPLNAIKAIVLITVLLGECFVFSGLAYAQTTGQIVRDPLHNNRMIYHNQMINGHPKPVVLCGPGDPENLFYMGNTTQNNISFLISKGARTTYVHAYLKDFGGGNPGDPDTSAFDNTISQWDTWITQLEDAGITTVFFFFDDTQALPVKWETAVTKIVNKLKHHKLLIWSVAEEYGEALSTSDVINVANKIKSIDTNNHVVGVHQNNGTNFQFNSAANLEMFLIQYNNANSDSQYVGVKNAFNNTSGNKILNMAEAAGHAGKDLATFRKINWAVIMAGASMVQVYEMGFASGFPSGNDANNKYDSCQDLMNFFEKTRINEMVPVDNRAAGDTKWVLANPNGSSYIVYDDNRTGVVGLTNMTAGTYQFTWVNIPTGTTYEQTISVGSGTQTWNPPAGVGSEMAVYIRTSLGGPTSTPNPTVTPLPTIGNQPGDMDADGDLDIFDRNKTYSPYNSSTIYNYNKVVKNFGN